MAAELSDDKFKFINERKNMLIEVKQNCTGKWERLIDNDTKITYPEGYDPRFKNGKNPYHFIDAENLSNKDFLPSDYI